MGAGAVERVALLQLAVEEAVYLVDLVELAKTLTDAEWVELAEGVFCQGSVLKIGKVVWLLPYPGVLLNSILIELYV